MNSFGWVPALAVVMIWIVGSVSGICEEYSGKILSTANFEPLPYNPQHDRVSIVRGYKGPNYYGTAQCSLFNHDANECGSIYIVGDFFQSKETMLFTYDKNGKTSSSLPFTVQQPDPNLHVYTFTTKNKLQYSLSGRLLNMAGFDRSYSVNERMGKFTIAILAANDQPMGVFGVRICLNNENDTSSFRTKGRMIMFFPDLLDTLKAPVEEAIVHTQTTATVETDEIVEEGPSSSSTSTSIPTLKKYAREDALFRIASLDAMIESMITHYTNMLGENYFDDIYQVSLHTVNLERRYR